MAGMENEKVSKRGGKRPGAGRKKTGRKLGSPHRARPALLAMHPAHVVLRTTRELQRNAGTLRQRCSRRARAKRDSVPAQLKWFTDQGGKVDLSRFDPRDTAEAPDGRSAAEKALLDLNKRLETLSGRGNSVPAAEFRRRPAGPSDHRSAVEIVAQSEDQHPDD